MQAQDIEKYLSQLGQELVKLGVDRPIRVLMIGGAYMMLLADAPRSTDDVDIFTHLSEQTNYSMPKLQGIITAWVMSAAVEGKAKVGGDDGHVEEQDYTKQSQQGKGSPLAPRRG